MAGRRAAARPATADAGWGELLNPRWPDVDLDGRQITIKGSTGVVTILREQQKAQEAEKARVGDSWKGADSGHVFTTAWGGPIYPTTVTALPGKLIKAYNEPEGKDQAPAEPLPYARLHDLRHIHATTLLLAGVPGHVVAARLGHADPAITLRVYAHVIHSAETAAADVFAKALE
ncbi:integrase [Streptosporangium becharense]|uniref:Integrase n=1 Tax=Streptosporangium becharense TaxID=1816182 RepID=A0A7W9MHK6_9ACTN|nr:tyrosine-type recombinase/integrase [Streptosporangium becharense]MBB2912597.1 integrase [Streptosporangium becharense]MBB5820573.1 integrase [Streptosporangium becharense]